MAVATLTLPTSSVSLQRMNWVESDGGRGGGGGGGGEEMSEMSVDPMLLDEVEDTLATCLTGSRDASYIHDIARELQGRGLDGVDHGELSAALGDRAGACRRHRLDARRGALPLSSCARRIIVGVKGWIVEARNHPGTHTHAHRHFHPLQHEDVRPFERVRVVSCNLGRFRPLVCLLNTTDLART